MEKKKKVLKQSGIILTIFFSTLAGVERANTVSVPKASDIDKFVEKYNLDTDYLWKISRFGKDIYKRCEVNKGEKIYFCYDNTIKEDYKVAAIERAANYFTSIFSTINPDYKFEAKKVEKKYIMSKNEIYVTTGSRKLENGNEVSYHNSRFNFGTGDCYKIIQSTIYMKDTVSDFYLTLLHETMHALGILDAYKLLDEKKCSLYDKTLQTIMGYKKTGFGIGELDYKILCALYGKYTETTLSKYEPQMLAYSQKVQKYFLVKEQDRQFFSNFSKITKEFAQNNGIDTTNVNIEWEFNKNMKQPIYLVDNTSKNLMKFGKNWNYDIYDTNNKQITYLHYDTSYVFIKLSDDACLFKLGDYYIQADSKKQTCTNLYTPITKDQYDTIVNSKSISTEPDLTF